MNRSEQLGRNQKVFVNPYKILDDLDPMSSPDEIKQRFLKMSKQFHPDMHQTDKQQYEQKFKEIKLAYEQIKEEKKEEFKDMEGHKQSINRPNQRFDTDYEEQRQKNVEEEDDFINNSWKMSKDEKMQWERDFINRRQARREEVKRQQNMTDDEKQQEERRGKIMGVIGSVLVLLGGLVVYVVGNDVLDKVYLLQETKEIDDQIKDYQDNIKDTSRFEKEQVAKYKLMQEQADDYQIRFHIQYYYIRQPIMKKFPIRHKHPHPENMLVDFTLFPDLKFYEVPAKMFRNHDLFSRMEEKELIGRDRQFEKQQLGFCKIQTKIAHAVEAERVLKNVYVKKEYVRKQIIQNGYYKPPPIYFRYYGYIQLKLRRKPINVEKFIECDKPYISLFDLFFKYNSPLNLAYDIFYDFKMLGYGDVQGNIKFNPRKIRPVYIDNDSIKNVFCWWYRKATPNMKQEDINNLHLPNYCDGTYESIWDGFYSNYSNKILTRMM